MTKLQIVRSASLPCDKRDASSYLRCSNHGTLPNTPESLFALHDYTNRSYFGTTCTSYVTIRCSIPQLTAQDMYVPRSGQVNRTRSTAYMRQCPSINLNQLGMNWLSSQVAEAIRPCHRRPRHHFPHLKRLPQAHEVVSKRMLTFGFLQ